MSEAEKQNRYQALPIFDPKDPARKIDEKEEKRLREIKEYEFYNLEEPGMMITFSYGSGKNIERFKLMHGGKYRLPVFIARHIESRSTPINTFRAVGDGRIGAAKAGENVRFRLREVY